MSDLYLAMCEARTFALTAWREWLQSRPVEHVATDELMATQAAFRSLHDLETGRFVLSNDPDLGPVP